MALLDPPVHFSKEIKVSARDRWNGTGLTVNAGQRYSLVADKADTWRDFYIVTNADGFTSEKLASYEQKKILPGAPWCALLARVGRDGNPFLVGMAWNGVVSATGELGLLANDASGFYWNNFGSVTVTMTRLA